VFQSLYALAHAFLGIIQQFLNTHSTSPQVRLITHQGALVLTQRGTEQGAFFLHIEYP
jgi:hypothetical protein